MRTRLGNLVLLLLTFVLFVPAVVVLAAVLMGHVQDESFPWVAGIGADIGVVAATAVAGRGRLWPFLVTGPFGYFAGWGLVTLIAAVDRGDVGSTVLGGAVGLACFVLGPLASLLIPLHEPRWTVLDIFDFFG